MKGKVAAVCISERRGTEKKEVPEVHFLPDFGIEGDAHAGKWHRQVSLLSFEKVEEFCAKGISLAAGAFGENLLIEGIPLRSLAVGTRILAGTAELRVTQLGKKCHQHCTIFHQVGDCIMPREGIFAEVLKEGMAKKGDAVEVLPLEEDRPFSAAILTVSDKGFRGEREDLSGRRMRELLEQENYRVITQEIVPDEPAKIKEMLRHFVYARQAELILTTGGTGFSKRDCTPEATLSLGGRVAPGIAEYLRYRSLEKTKRAALSRGTAVLLEGSLIVNLPGSPKAVEECLSFLFEILPHGLSVLRGSSTECGRK